MTRYITDKETCVLVCVRVPESLKQKMRSRRNESLNKTVLRLIKAGLQAESNLNLIERVAEVKRLAKVELSDEVIRLLALFTRTTKEIELLLLEIEMWPKLLKTPLTPEQVLLILDTYALMHPYSEKAELSE